MTSRILGNISYCALLKLVSYIIIFFIFFSRFHFLWIQRKKCAKLWVWSFSCTNLHIEVRLEKGSEFTWAHRSALSAARVFSWIFFYKIKEISVRQTLTFLSHWLLQKNGKTLNLGSEFNSNQFSSLSNCKEMQQLKEILHMAFKLIFTTIYLFI